MADAPGPAQPAGKEGMSTGARIAKNTAAMVVVALLTRGAGLIVAVLVARLLDPTALGTYGVVIGLQLIFQEVAPLGLGTSVIRDVARDPARLLTIWLNASVVTAASSAVLSGVLLGVVHLAGYTEGVRSSAAVVAVCLPLTGLHAIARSAIQGLELMEYQTLAALMGRGLGLLLMWLLLRAGVGVEAAFIGDGLFQATGLLILVWAIVRRRQQAGAAPAGRLEPRLWGRTLSASFPFAVQNWLQIALTRVNTVILPFLVSMALVGQFDAADRIGQTAAMVVPMVLLSILPTLSRTYITEPAKATFLLEKAFKLLLVAVFPFVFLVAIAADLIIPMLYGPGYEAAVPVLQVVIWAQLFFVADGALNQVLIASNNEGPMVRRTALALGANVALTVGLVPRFGLQGAAWAVVATGLIILGLHAQYVVRHVMRFRLREAVARPLACALLSGGVALLAHGQGLWVLLAASLGAYAGLLLALRVFSGDELGLVRELSDRMWRRVGALRR